MKLTHAVPGMLLAFSPLVFPDVLFSSLAAAAEQPAPLIRAQLEPGSNPAVAPNALDFQDRARDVERQRARDDIRSRLGDRAPDLNRHQGFASPRTDAKPGVSDPDAAVMPLPPTQLPPR